MPSDAPTLWDSPVGALARATDAPTAHEAARATSPGSHALVQKIRGIVLLHGPMTAFEVADILTAQTDRWEHDTVRTRCCNAGLRRWPVKVKRKKTGRDVQQWYLLIDDVPIESTPPL